jgi:hypothetical protein
MLQTSVPETLVIHIKLSPGYNPKTFKQHYDHGGSLQLQSEFFGDKNVLTVGQKSYFAIVRYCV